MPFNRYTISLFISLMLVAVPQSNAAELPTSAPKDWASQHTLLQGIRKLPATENTRVISWIEFNQSVLPPIFLMEHANRQFLTDRSLALETFTLARIRSEYDIFRCADKTAWQAASLLSMFAPNVAFYGRDNPKLYSEVGMSVLNRDDLLDHTSSPEWVCHHGMQSVLGKNGGLIPESEWPKLKTTIKNKYQKFFAELASPPKELAPQASIPLKVTPFPRAIDKFSHHSMSWLDENRLVYVLPYERDAPAINLFVWNINENSHDIYESAGHIWCAGAGNFFYEKSRERLERGIKTTLTNTTPSETLEFTLELSSPYPLSSMTYNGILPRIIAKHPMPNYQDCSWKTPEETNAEPGKAAWYPLREGHGFLSIRDNTLLHRMVDRDGEPVSRYALNSDFQGELNKIETKSIKGKRTVYVQYYEFKKAYFIAVINEEKDEVGSKACQSAWWYDPTTQSLDQICTPSPGELGWVIYAPSKFGLIRYLASKRTARGKVPGGVFLTDTDGKTSLLWKGMIWDGAVSPDGCKIAVATYQNEAVLMDICVSK